MSDKQTFEDFMGEWECTPDCYNYIIEASHDKSDKSFYVQIAQPRKDRIESEVIFYETKADKDKIIAWLEKNRKYINDNFIREM